MNKQVDPSLPDSWSPLKIGDVLDFNYGKGLPAEQRKEGTIPVYGSNGRVGCHDESLITGPALIVGRKGSVGEVHYEEGPCWPIDTTYFINEFYGLNPRFIFHQLRYLNLGKFEKSTAIPGISRTDIYDKALLLCPLNEQERIADTIDELLSDLDAGVASLKSAQKKLEHYRAAVLKAAVEGSLTAERRRQNPDTEPASELLKRILAERRCRWEEERLRKFAEAGKKPPKNWKGKYKEPNTPDTSKLPKLPKGWEYTFLEPLLSTTRPGMKTGPFGSLLKKHQHRDKGVPVLGIENIAAMKFKAGSKIHIDGYKAEQLAAYEALPGDVLISRSGTVGEVAVVPEGLGTARISTNLMRVVLQPGGMSPMFFCVLFNGSPLVLNQVSELCSGSTRDFLNQEILSKVVFPLPPLSEQEAIIEAVEDQLSVVEHIESDTRDKLKAAQALRQSILRHAFTGRLVPQDPDDEPASELLKRIAAEREERGRQAAAAKRHPSNQRKLRKRANAAS
jgi:type I restriction enzyme, S subunit